MTSDQPAEKPLGCAGITPALEKNVNDIAILVNGAPQLMLFTSDLDEDLIDNECVSIARVLAAQALGNLRPKRDAPEADRFTADGNTPFGEEVFDISVAQTESMVQPIGVTDDLGRKPVSVVNVHPRMFDWRGLNCQYLQYTHGRACLTANVSSAVTLNSISIAKSSSSSATPYSVWKRL